MLTLSSASFECLFPTAVASRFELLFVTRSLIKTAPVDGNARFVPFLRGQPPRDSARQRAAGTKRTPAGVKFLFHVSMFRYEITCNRLNYSLLLLSVVLGMYLKRVQEVSVTDLGQISSGLRRELR